MQMIVSLLGEVMDSIAEYYDNLAFQYDDNRFQNSYGQYIDALERSILSSILAGSNPQENLEVACGTGRLLQFANTGVDISPKMLHVAQKKHPSAHLVEASFDSIPLADRSYSNMYSFHFLMHLDESKAERFSKEAMRLLKDDGRLIVDVPSHIRRRFKPKRRHWHGSYAPQVSLFERWGWTICGMYPIMYVPIHRVPNRFRSSFLNVERVLSSFVPPRYASYVVLEMKKTR